jgi:hypothetical protein
MFVFTEASSNSDESLEALERLVPLVRHNIEATPRLSGLL